MEFHMDFHKIWQEQCEATRTIRERFGVKNALDYLHKNGRFWTPLGRSSIQLDAFF